MGAQILAGALERAAGWLAGGIRTTPGVMQEGDFAFSGPDVFVR